MPIPDLRSSAAPVVLLQVYILGLKPFNCFPSSLADDAFDKMISFHCVFYIMTCYNKLRISAKLRPIVCSGLYGENDWLFVSPSLDYSNSFFTCFGKKKQQHRILNENFNLDFLLLTVRRHANSRPLNCRTVETTEPCSVSSMTLTHFWVKRLLSR